MTPTDEQLAIIAAARDTSDNLLIDALAGAAKTSTLVMLSSEVRTPTLSIAFNKRIATELQNRMPGHVECRTLNALGHRAWMKFLGRGVKVNANKRGDILKELVNALPQHDKDAAWGNFSDLHRAIAAAAGAGYVPSKCKGRGIVGDETLFASLWWEPSPLEEHLIAETSRIAIDEGLAGNIDFSDQILLPVIFPARFDKLPLTLVDEAQDLSELNHRMLEKIVGERIIAVGDPCQAIYEFRGADSESMEKLRTKFKMRTLHLSISFRCPRVVTEHVQWRAPHMKSPEWAKEGTITRLGSWSSDDIPADAAIICRNNAPLFRLALRLLQDGRRPQIIGNDVIKTLMRDMKKLGPKSLRSEDAAEAVEDWRRKNKKKYKNAAWVDDKADCMMIFIDEADSLGGALAYAEKVLNGSGPIQLMTGHKSKGLEFDHVFFLDQHLINPERGGQQEDNLRYVICTRAMETLTYVDSEFYGAMQEKETA